MVDTLQVPMTLVILGIITTVCSVFLVLTKPKNNTINGTKDSLESIHLAGSQ